MSDIGNIPPDEFDRILKNSIAFTYSYLVGYAVGGVAGGGSEIAPSTLGDLEQAMLNLGMTREDVAQIREAALRKPEGT